MIKKLVLFLVIVFMTGCTDIKTCDPNGKIVCYENESTSFKLEDNMDLTVAVRNKEYGQALVELWNKIHPDYKNAVKYKEVDEFTAIYYLINEDIDLMYIDSEDAALLIENIYPCDKKLEELINKNLYEREMLINEEKMLFVPMEYQGFCFAYNQKILEDLNIDLTDNNNDNLPDALDTFEEIFRLMKTNENAVFCYYPLSFTEKYSLYPLLTAGGFNMYSSNLCSKPGFDSDEFLKSLRFISELSEFDVYQNVDLSASELPFALDTVLVENNTMLTLISNMMYINYEDEDAKYVFSKMPSYNGNTLTPLCDVYGYSISAFTDCPSAANELLRIIRSKEGLEVFVQTTDCIPYVDEPLEIENLDEERVQKSMAYKSSTLEPIIALTSDNTKRAWDMYYEIDFLTILRALYDKQISCETAQMKIVDLANKWLKDNGVEIVE